jgi:hypothetical protein
MATLHELHRVRSELRMVPTDHTIFLGLGMALPKRNAIEIDPQRLPAQHECNAVAGLDVMLLYRGNDTRYGVLRTLAERLYQAAPRRLQLIDTDISRIAYLKLAKAA